MNGSNVVQLIKENDCFYEFYKNGKRKKYKKYRGHYGWVNNLIIITKYFPHKKYELFEYLVSLLEPYWNADKNSTTRKKYEEEQQQFRKDNPHYGLKIYWKIKEFYSHHEDIKRYFKIYNQFTSFNEKLQEDIDKEIKYIGTMLCGIIYNYENFL